MTTKLFLLAGLILPVAVSALIAFSPIQSPSLPTPIPTAPPSNTQKLSGLVAHFDRTTLPKPAEQKNESQASPQPLDLTAPLRQYRYLGMAASDKITAGIFTDGAQTHVLRENDLLEGFAISQLSADAAVFIVDEGDFKMLIMETSEQNQSAPLLFKTYLFEYQ